MDCSLDKLTKLSFLVSDLMEYANQLPFGYMKYHKSAVILTKLHRQSSIMEDEVRFLNYLKNSLLIEGFRAVDCELIMGWLYERKNIIA